MVRGGGAQDYGDIYTSSQDVKNPSKRPKGRAYLDERE